MQQPKTLLIVASKPGSNNVGEILIKEMLDVVGSKQHYIASLMHEFSPDESVELKDYQIRGFNHPPERIKRRLNNQLGGVLAHLERRMTLSQLYKDVANKIIEYARECGIERVWVIINSPSVAEVASIVTNQLDVPLLTHVWDDIEHLARQGNAEGLTRLRYQALFKKLLQKSEKTAVICENMAEFYTKNYCAKCVIIRLGLDKVTKQNSRDYARDEYWIGFSGGMYCHSAWNCFIEAMDKLDWQVGSRKIRLILMSGDIRVRTRVPANVEFLGWRDNNSVLSKLAECDLLYLPQAFEQSEEPLTKLSFPTKLSSYSAAGRPILIHAPAYASLIPFHKNYPVGPCCETLDSQELARKINDFGSDNKLIEQAIEQVNLVSGQILNRESFTNQVKKFLLARIN